MSPHAVRGTGTHHAVETVERGRERGWEENCLGDELPHYEMQGNASCMYCISMPHYAMLQSTSTWNSDTCAYVSTLLTSRGPQALFVVNSIKLHLTAYKFSVSTCIFIKHSKTFLSVALKLVDIYTTFYHSEFSMYGTDISWHSGASSICGSFW